MHGRFVDPWKPKRPGSFHLGDRVRTPYGSEFIKATIVEDHGNRLQQRRQRTQIRWAADVTDEIYMPKLERRSRQFMPIFSLLRPKRSCD